MRIAIDFRVKKDFSPSVNAFLEQLWFEMAAYKPAYTYFFLKNDTTTENAPRENIILQTIKKSGFGWLNEKRLLDTLNEYRVDKYIRLQEDGYCVIKAEQKLIGKKDFLNPPQRIVFAECYKSGLQLSSNSKSVIGVITPALQNVVSAISWAEAESIKTQYSGGRDFFLYTGDIDVRHQLIELLKAFSLFKKWQQSNMQLLIAGYSTGWTEWFEEQLLYYKYRNDVVLLKDLPAHETAKIIAASYTVLYPAAENNLPLPLIQAIQSGVASIASDILINRQLTDTAVWVDNNNLQEGFAKAMILLYKDESQKATLVQRAKEEAKRFSREQMLGEVWQSLQEK